MRNIKLGLVIADIAVSNISSGTQLASSAIIIRLSECNHASASGCSFAAVLALAYRAALSASLSHTLR